MYLKHSLSLHLLINDNLHIFTFLAFHQPPHPEELNDGCKKRISFSSWMFSVTGDSKANAEPLMIMNDGGEHGAELK